MTSFARVSTVFFALLTIYACEPKSDTASLDTTDAPAVALVDTARIQNAAREPEMWLTYGGSYDEQRHSTLGQINRDTLSELGVGWVYEMAKPRGAEATPIVVDGVMYVSSAWSVVYAIDAKTGEEIWVYDPEVSGKDAAKGCCDVVAWPCMTEKCL
jgi:quinohemoprotein ethanol dehydrogenase